MIDLSGIQLDKTRAVPLYEQLRQGILNQIRAQGGARQAAGDLVLDPDWRVRVKRALPTHGLCLTEAGVEAAFPQCTIAPAAEGTPIFVIPRKD